MSQEADVPSFFDRQRTPSDSYEWDAYSFIFSDARVTFQGSDIC